MPILFVDTNLLILCPVYPVLGLVSVPLHLVSLPCHASYNGLAGNTRLRMTYISQSMYPHPSHFFFINIYTLSYIGWSIPEEHSSIWNAACWFLSIMEGFFLLAIMPSVPSFNLIPNPTSRLSPAIPISLSVIGLWEFHHWYLDPANLDANCLLYPFIGISLLIPTFSSLCLVPLPWRKPINPTANLSIVPSWINFVISWLLIPDWRTNLLIVYEYRHSSLLLLSSSSDGLSSNINFFISSIHQAHYCHQGWYQNLRYCSATLTRISHGLWHQHPSTWLCLET